MRRAPQYLSGPSRSPATVSPRAALLNAAVPSSSRRPEVSQYTSIAAGGVGYNRRLQDRIASLEAQLAQRDTTITSLLQEMAGLEKMKEALTKAERATSIVENALMIDRMVAGHEQPLALSADAVTGGITGLKEGVSLWNHLSLTVLKRERDRRVTDIVQVKKQLTAQLTAANEQHVAEVARANEQHVAEVARLRQQLDELQAEVQKLRIPASPGALPEDEASVVNDVLEAALQDIAGGQGAPPLEGDDDFDFSTWDFADLFSSLNLPQVFAGAFEAALFGPELPPGLDGGVGRRAVLNALGGRGSKDTVRAILQSGPLLTPLTDAIWDGIANFKEDCDLIASAKAAERVRREADSEGVLYSRESQDGEDMQEEAIDLSDPSQWNSKGARELMFGGPGLFFTAMRDLIGSPSCDGLPAMAREHTTAADSDLRFTAPNCEAHSRS